MFPKVYGGNAQNAIPCFTAPIWNATPKYVQSAIITCVSLRGGGVVVQISSDAAVEAYPGWGAYGASKAAADHLLRVLAAELDGTGVRCVAFDPGEMDTAMHAAALPDADRTALRTPDSVATELLDALAEPSRTVSGARVVLGAEGAR